MNGVGDVFFLALIFLNRGRCHVMSVMLFHLANKKHTDPGHFS